jgi:hypothetical protein
VPANTAIQLSSRFRSQAIELLITGKQRPDSAYPTQGLLKVSTVQLGLKLLLLKRPELIDYDFRQPLNIRKAGSAGCPSSE